MFSVRLSVPVTDSNREIEFIDLKQRIRQELIFAFGEGSLSEPLEFDAMSCEHIAEWLLNEFPEAETADVYEDGENGAWIARN